MATLSGLLCFLSVSVIAGTQASKLLFFLVDGFRWDYFNLPGLQLEGFKRLIEQGTKAEWLIPDFPTNSMPNYKTLETGLHVENHGFVGNYMYDDQSGKEFRMTMDNPESRQPFWWNKAESFYITAEKQGLKTALYHVMGCDIKHEGISPTYCVPYLNIPAYEETERAVKDAFDKMINDHVDIVYIYHQKVDFAGHNYGPNSEEIKQAVLEVDSHVRRMLDIIETEKLDNIDIIIASDHGMASIDQLHKINITEVLDMKNVKEITEGGTQAYIWPVAGKVHEVYSQLKSFHPHLKVYLRDDLIDRWFFKKHRLIPPIFLTTDKGWYIIHPKSSDKYFESYGRIWNGNHGFDNKEVDMRSIFIAYGPDFRSNFIAKPFSNVNVYQLICHVSGIKAKPNNGTWSKIKDILRSRGQHLEL